MLSLTLNAPRLAGRVSAPISMPTAAMPVAAMPVAATSAWMSSGFAPSLADPAASQAASRLRTSSAQRSAGLLIEDAPLRAAIVFALDAQGVRVRTYADLADLLDADEDTGCLIIDLAPYEPDPTELLYTLHRHRPLTPMIVLTSSLSARTGEAIAAVGATVIEKPLLTDSLCIAVDRLTASMQ